MTDSYKVTSYEIGKFIRVTVTDTEGNTFSAVTTEGVIEDNTNTVEITDASGIQTDGTGKVGDTLNLTYGSGLGTLSEINWYRDDKVIVARNAQGGNLTEALRLTTGGTGQANTNMAGKYYVVIKNTDGTEFKSNTIELTQNETAAVIKSFAISDSYTTDADQDGTIDKVAFSNVDGYAIATITMNRDYAGTFQVYDVNDTSISTTTTKIGASGIGSGVHTTGNTGAGGFTVETNSTKMTDKDVSEQTTTFAKKFINPTTGEVTYKFAFNNAATAGPTRGKSYVVVFDQTNISTDNIGTGTVNKSEAAVAPYLTAPASVTVSQFTQSTTTKLAFLDDKGEKLAWINGNSAANIGFDSIKLYNIKSSSKGTSDTATNPTAVTAEKGEATLTTTALSDLYVYGVLETTKGVFAADSAKIETAVAEGATAAAANVKLEEDATAANAKITLESYKSAAKGKIVIYQGTSSHNGSVAEVVQGTKVKEVEVNGGEATVTIENVFSEVATTSYLNEYVAVLVPDDTSVYQEVRSNLFTIGQTATTIKFAHDDSSASGVSSGVITLSDTGLIAYDQFGKKMTTAQVLKDVTSVVSKDDDTTTTERATAQYSVADSGVVTVIVTPNNSGQVDKGDGFTITVLGSTITCMAKNDGLASNGNSTQGLEVKVGSDTMLTGTYAKAIGNSTTAMTTDTATATYGTATVALNSADDLISDATTPTAFTPVQSTTEKVLVYSDQALKTSTGKNVVFTITQGSAQVSAALESATALTPETYYFKYLGCTYTLTVNKINLSSVQFKIAGTGANLTTPTYTAEATAVNMATPGSTATVTTAEVDGSSDLNYTITAPTGVTFTAAKGTFTGDNADGVTVTSTGVITVAKAADQSNDTSGTITLTGTGNYTGTVTITFTVTDAS